MFIQNLENHLYVFCPKIYGIVDCMQHIKMSVSSEKSRQLTNVFAQVRSQVESSELKPLETVNSANSASSVKCVNSVKSVKKKLWFFFCFLAQGKFLASWETLESFLTSHPVVFRAFCILESI